MSRGFSSEFSRRTGLEIVSPAIRELRVDRGHGRVGDWVTVHWDASNNPPGSSVTLSISVGPQTLSTERSLPLSGSQSFQLASTGQHFVGIEVRPASRSRRVIASTAVMASSMGESGS